MLNNIGVKKVIRYAIVAGQCVKSATGRLVGIGGQVIVL